MADQEASRHTASIVIKRFATGLGFELVYPIASSSEEREVVKENFLACLEDLEELIDQVGGLCDEKDGYKPEPVRRPTRRPGRNY